MVPSECSSASTIADGLWQPGQYQPAKPAFTFLVDGASQEVSLTYGDVDRQPRAIAATLQSKDLDGERALLLCPPGLSFVSVLFGRFYGAVTAVPSDLPRPRRPVARWESIANDSQSAVNLTTAELSPELQTRFEDHPFDSRTCGIAPSALDSLSAMSCSAP